MRDVSESDPADPPSKWRADRLDYLLPQFTRVSWTGESARKIWAPRLEKIATAWRVIEMQSVADGVRDCALVKTRISSAVVDSAVADGGRWPQGEFKAEIWPTIDSIDSRYTYAVDLSTPNQKPRADVAVGNANRLRELRDAVEARQHEEIGRLLGYPTCCRSSFVRLRVTQECLDITWPIAAASADRQRSDFGVTVNGPIETNILWRWLGIRAIPHLPCSLECAESRQLGTTLLELGSRYGYTSEIGWIREVLSWPVQWSALHGIAEIKTPVLKMATRTDATACKYSLEWQGRGQTIHAAQGLSFPFQAPSRRNSSAERAFQRGMDQAMERNGTPQ